jgi:protein-S-isoprenylcysteine O-methyltransferase Ste14
VTFYLPIEEKTMNKKLIARYAFRETMGVIFMGVILLWSAGRIDWLAAWAVIIVTAAWVLATAIVIIRFNPELLAERLGPRKGAKSWDTAIVSMLGITQVFRYAVAGLDQRYGWSGDIPIAAQITGLIVCILGYALFVWATYSNAFFSQVVRIQSEHGHTVVKSGPYQYVRHPAYIGAILFEFAVSVTLASWWALIFSIIGAVLLILRTKFEDRTLQAELPGYQEYTLQVPNRLLPGVW